MRIHCLEVTSRKGVGQHNEDRAVCTARGAAAIDGATGLGGRRRFSDTSDAAWFAETLADALSRLLCDDRPLLDNLAEAVRAARREADHRMPEWRSLAPHEQPSASLAAVKLREDALEYAILGDCTLALRAAAGPVRVFSDPRLAPLDDAVIRFIHERQRKGQGYEEAKAEALPLLRANRNRMNTPDGYFAASLDGKGIPHAVTGRLPAEAGLRGVLSSDGFSRAVDLFGLADWAALTGSVRPGEAGPLAAAADRLRQAEANDPDCLRHPRLKVSDDATAILFEILA
ncbi:MAG: protein phosphatase 2C domain-containing protein [Alicyclobacillus macrosporangiidus]|uniref:protein phosphatase 2C domain-containing protein n=1 Tax=Alicyclobacillus macrosporangiidus TaxID=392015 RepID=UPI0026F327E1|nr:protein phosphatase 2C domain-containing protein [Alicyclobacillus macrosporangiidus]MCL6599911.1 protein phosphatase 2C domain-containing protein [Alicyclobacillus macrosporangiidus]